MWWNTSASVEKMIAPLLFVEPIYPDTGSSLSQPPVLLNIGGSACLQVLPEAPTLGARDVPDRKGPGSTNPIFIRTPGELARPSTREGAGTSTGLGVGNTSG